MDNSSQPPMSEILIGMMPPYTVAHEPEPSDTSGSAEQHPQTARQLARAVVDRLTTMRLQIQELQLIVNQVLAGKVTFLAFNSYIALRTRQINGLLHDARKCYDELVVAEAAERAQATPRRRNPLSLAILHWLHASDQRPPVAHDGVGPVIAEYLTRVRCAWEETRVAMHLVHISEQSPPHSGSPARGQLTQDQLRQLNLVVELLDDIVYSIGCVVIPGRVQQWLNNSRPGYPLPFHQIFADELPDPKDREKLFQSLVYSPLTLRRALVDPQTAVIYRISESGWKRWLSVGTVAAALGATAGLLALLWMLPLGDPSLKAKASLGTLLFAWCALLTGVAVHAAVDLQKRAQGQTAELPFVVVDFTRQVSAKLTRILLKIVLALFAFLVLILAPGAGPVQVFNAFLVGYSLDSFIGLFDQHAAAQASAMKQQASSGAR